MTIKKPVVSQHIPSNSTYHKCWHSDNQSRYSPSGSPYFSSIVT